MSTDQPTRPTFLANLLLICIVGAALFVFFAFIRGCGKKAARPPVAKEQPAKDKPATTEKKEEPSKPQLTQEDYAKAVAKANEVRPKSGPVAADPAEKERTRQLLLDTGPRKPFTEVPKEFQPPQPPAPTTPVKPAISIPTAPATTPPVSISIPTAPATTPPVSISIPTAPATTPPVSISIPTTPNGQVPPAMPAEPSPGPSAPADGPPSTPEAVREVETASPEGAALLADATARIDEAPVELYSDKAKAKVREGLKGARRIFKVHTVFFEKGGAITQEKDVTQLTKSLEAPNLQEVMADPRSVFFVLGFADKTGAADTNKKLSVARADAVIGLLRDKCGVLNFTYPVAVGSSELVAPANKEKNRAAEVWLVLP